LRARRLRLFSTLKAAAQWLAAVAMGYSVLKDVIEAAWQAFTQWIKGGTP
jgi:hypothetical protein